MAPPAHVQELLALLERRGYPVDRLAARHRALGLGLTEGIPVTVWLRGLSKRNTAVLREALERHP